MHPIDHMPLPFEKEKIGRAGLLAFIEISNRWDLTTEQRIRLLGIPKSTYFDWKKKVEAKKNISLDADTLERISYILGIYKALNILLPTEKDANEWIHKSNDAWLFNGQTCLEKMLAGRVVDLADVRRYLDGQRGSIYG